MGEIAVQRKGMGVSCQTEALNHRGFKSDKPGQLSVEFLCEQTGESKNQIFRLVRLTELVPDLLDKVDARQLAFNPAVELSYLSHTEQAMVVETMAKFEVRPSISQAQRLKKLSQSAELTSVVIDAIFSSEEKKPPGKDKDISRFKRFFPDGYSTRQMEKVINDLLQAWRTKAE